MIKIFIQGLKDGKHKVKLNVPVETIPEMSAEFFGDVIIEGVFRKHHNRYAFECSVSCDARLICDLSVKEFEETIIFDYKTSFIKDTNMFFGQQGRELREHEERAVHNDDKYIDITEDIREELILHLPMKRIAPEFRDKNFEDIYPDYANKKISDKSEQNIDDRWSVLKNIKLD